MRSIRHGVSTLYRTANIACSSRNFDRSVSAVAVPHPKSPVPSHEGKEKATEVESRCEEDPPLKDLQPKETGTVEHIISEFEAVTRAHDEGPPLRSSEPSDASMAECPAQAQAFKSGIRHTQFIARRRSHRFFQSPRLPPLPHNLTDIVVPSAHSQLYKLQPSPAFTPRKSTLSAPSHLSLSPESVPGSSVNVREGSFVRKRKSPKRRASPCSLSTAEEPISHSSGASTPSRDPTSRLVIEPRTIPIPIPISHGFGKVQVRAERYRETMRQRRKSEQGILEALSGKEGTMNQGPACWVGEGTSEVAQPAACQQGPDSEASSSYPPGSLSTTTSSRPFRHRRPPFTLSARTTNTHTPQGKVFNNSFRTYSRPASSISDSSPHEGLPQVSVSTVPQAFVHADSNIPSLDANPIGGFSTGWKGEEWKDEWSTEDLAASGLSHLAHTKKTFRLLRFRNTKGSLRPGHGGRVSSVPRISLPNIRNPSSPRGAKRVRPLQPENAPRPPPPLKPLRLPLALSDEAATLVSRLKGLLGKSDTTEVGHHPGRHGYEVQMHVPPVLPVSSPVAVHPHVSPNKKSQRRRPDADWPSRLATSEEPFDHFNILGAVRALSKEKPPFKPMTDAESANLLRNRRLLGRKVSAGEREVENVSSAKSLGQEGEEKKASEDMESATKETIEVPSSKTAAKLKRRSLKVKAKQEFQSRLMAAAVQQRKEVKAMRKQKQVEAWRSMHVGELKPLGLGQDVLEDVHPPQELRPIPRLAYGLDRVLFNQSVHWIQDPHSRVFNFSPNLQSLPAVTDFAFERLAPYVSSSRDEDLHTLAVRHSKTFAGSTSSLTKVLAHIYFLISGDRWVDTSTLSTAFVKEPRTFTPGMRMPATIVLHHRRNFLDENGELIRTSTHGIEDQGPQDDAQPSSSKPQPSSSLGVAAQTTAGSESPSASDISEGEQVESSSLSLESQAVSTTNGGAELEGATSLPPESSIPAEDGSDSDGVDGRSSASLTGTEGGPSETSVSLDGDASNAAGTPKESNANDNRFMDTYAIDSGLGDRRERREAELNVLLWLGTMAEKFLTMSEQSFSTLLRKNPVSEAIVEDKRREAYRYSKSSEFVMRSQLDCQDSRLPGTGVFDIKTRAVLPIRIDQLNYQENSGYLIRKMTGLYESFEREYYDLIRAAFLKYNFQARIGAMDGVFVAYHNTARMFGFQYVTVKEMEERIYGPGASGRGEKIFEKCVGLMGVLVKEIVACFPGESLSCTIEAREGAGNLKVWVIPLVWNKKGSKPIAELTLTVSHVIDGVPVSSRSAIDRANEDWVLRYKISRSTKSRYKIWGALREVQERQFTLALPAGMTKDTMDSTLAAVNYGAGLGLKLDPESSTQREDQTPERDSDNTSRRFTKRFSEPGRRVQHLRQLAKAGRADIKREEERGRRQVVWGRDADDAFHHYEPEPTAEHASAAESAEKPDLGSNVNQATTNTPWEMEDYGIDDTWQTPATAESVPEDTEPQEQETEESARAAEVPGDPGCFTLAIGFGQPVQRGTDRVSQVQGAATKPQKADQDRQDHEASIATELPSNWTTHFRNLYAKFHL